MGRTFVSEKQRKLFEELSQFNDLIYACGPKGISANVYGQFRIKHYENEDRLELGDGNFHVHIDWERVKAVEFKVFNVEGRQEGLLILKDKEENLFRFYKQGGDFPEAVKVYSGSLL